MEDEQHLDLAGSIPKTVKHYLDRIRQILLLLESEPEAERLLSVRLAPDMFDTGFNFAIAVQFAARALCLPAKIELLDIPDTYSVATLLRFSDEVSILIEPISDADFAPSVSHRAGDAELVQTTAEYVSCFALPNMIFHFSVSYAGLRHGGMNIGKADFDGFHIY